MTDKVATVCSALLLHVWNNRLDVEASKQKNCKNHSMDQMYWALHDLIDSQHWLNTVRLHDRASEPPFCRVKDLPVRDSAPLYWEVPKKKILIELKWTKAESALLWEWCNLKVKSWTFFSQHVQVFQNHTKLLTESRTGNLCLICLMP